MIPLTVRNTLPMLASPQPAGDPRQELERLERTGKWTAEVKWDGHRCFAFVEGGGATLRSRNGSDLTSKHYKVAAKLGKVPEAMVLDGELVCLDAEGLPALSEVQRKGSSTIFVAFDILYHEDAGDLRTRTYAYRRSTLEIVTDPWFDSGTLRVTPAGPDGAHLWDTVESLGMEGVIVKRNMSIYNGGARSPDWVKFKIRNRISAIVVRPEPGKGSRASSFGALQLVVMRDREIVPIGKVGSGFTAADIKAITERLGPVGGLIVDVEYTSIVNGHLREPVFKKIRDDLSIEDCTIDQLEG